MDIQFRLSTNHSVLSGCISFIFLTWQSFTCQVFQYLHFGLSYLVLSTSWELRKIGWSIQLAVLLNSQEIDHNRSADMGANMAWEGRYEGPHISPHIWPLQSYQPPIYFFCINSPGSRLLTLKSGINSSIYSLAICIYSTSWLRASGVDWRQSSTSSSSWAHVRRC